MALIKRVTRLFQADMHAVLDSIEEPEALLKQSIREMEDALLQDRQYLKSLEKTLQSVQAQVNQYKQSAKDIEAELTLCLQNDNDDLAKTCIKRKLVEQRLMQGLTKKQSQIEENLEETRERINANQPRLEAMRQKRDVLSKTTRYPDFEDHGLCASFEVSDSEIEVALLKEKQLLKEKYAKPRNAS